MTQEQAIFNGSPQPTRQLAPAEIGALAVVDSSQGEVVCTATVIAPGWLLTAAHCALHGKLRIRLPRDSQPFLQVVRQVEHDSLDVMLLEVAQAAGVASAAIQLWPGAFDAGWLSMVVTLAGAGLTETGTAGELRFVEEPIVDVRETEIWVDGGGRTGACTGDSGGPMLLRDASDVLRIAGVLARGSADCLGIDVYTRADAFSDWTVSTLAEAGGSRCSTGELR